VIRGHSGAGSRRSPVHRKGHPEEVPFGPALAIGALLVLLAAPAAGPNPLF